MNKVSLQSLTLKNVGPFEDLHIDKIGAVIVVSGPNGCGKTTVVNGFYSLFENAHDATLIRDGSEKAEIGLVLSDGTKIERTITKKDTYARIKTADGRKVPKEETFLKGLGSGYRMDPVAFAQADKKKQLEFLLKVMPIEFSREEVGAAIPGVAVRGSYSLQDLDALIAGREEDRTEQNRKVRQQEATLASLKSSLPQGQEETDWIAESRRLQNEVSTKRRELREELGVLESNHGNSVVELNQAKAANIAAIRAEAERLIAEQEAQFQDRRDALRQQFEVQRATLLDARQPVIDTVHGEMLVAEERAAGAIRQQGVRDTIARIESEIKVDAVKATALTDQIEALRCLRKTKLETLPVPGVEIVDGEIYVDGRKFSALNEAERFKVAFQICAVARAADELPFFVCDYGNAFDARSFEWLKSAVISAGYQLIVTKVTDDDQIRIENAA